MTRQVQFHVKHLDVMDLRPLDRDSVLALDSVRYILQNLPENSAATTIIWDGRILACAGFWSPFPGMAEVWLIPSIYVNQNKFGFVRIVNRYLEALAFTFKWTRIQTVTRKDQFHRRWMQALKFTEEGVMKNYFQGQDYILSARYFEEGKSCCV